MISAACDASNSNKPSQKGIKFNLMTDVILKYNNSARHGEKNLDLKVSEARYTYVPKKNNLLLLNQQKRY